jgi:tetratricopeptide (TPR) repeat protein
MASRHETLIPASSPRTARIACGGAALIVAAIFVAWSNSLPAPFVLDDHDSITRNASIRAMWPPEWLTPPATSGETVSGRPVLNLSFALNRALLGDDVRGYRAVNVLLHAMAALVLFGIVRRTCALRREGIRMPQEAARGVSGRKAPPTVSGAKASRADEAWWGVGFALAVALIWGVHPLQTAAVTYVVQRAEALAGLFYLLTVYGFVRSIDARTHGRTSAGRWTAVAVTACALGMATKETMATAPLVVLLFDRAFVAGTLRGAWAARWRTYAMLASTWLLLGALVWSNVGRGGSAGLDAEIGAWSYLLTQCDAIVRYLALAVWPVGQVFDYGVETAARVVEVLPQALGLLVLMGGAIWALVRNRPAGFLGAAFFLSLAPSSSFVPVATQTIAEHRMYLPLAIVVIFLGAGVRRWGTKALSRGVTIGICAVVAAALIGTTLARNRVYRSELALWSDTVEKRPANPRAHHNLGQALVAAGRMDEAMAEFRAAIALRPEHAFARHNLGLLLLERNQPAEAAEHFGAALVAQPDYPSARAGLAEALVQLGRIEEAETALGAVRVGETEGLDVRAALTRTYFALGNAFAKERSYARAMTAYGEALALDSTHVQARANLANCLLVTGRSREAIEQYEAVLRERPEDEAVRRNLEIAREMLRR